MPPNRRAFQGTAAPGAGRAPKQEIAMPATSLRTAGSTQKLTKAEIPTPALVLDLDRFEANLKTLADQCKRTGCGARPHAKTHKCPEIARRQVATGALGASVATVPEAEVMVAAGIPGVLLTSPIVEPSKIMRMVKLARQSPDLMLAVGDPREMELLAQAAESHGVTFNILIDLDVGDRRFGALPGPLGLDLAHLAARSKSLRVRGVQAYSGLSSHVLGFAAREQASRLAMGKAVALRAELEKHGFEARILSGGSTGTYNIDSAIEGVTEIQAGSYVFMDVGYMQIGGKSGETQYLDFHPSLTVLATVVSAAHPDLVTIDAGTKAFSSDTADTPREKHGAKLKYQRSGDEFGRLSVEPGTALPKLGERLEFYVPHCDPTVNLYDRIYAVRGEVVEEIWPIEARREFQPPAV